MNSFIHINPRDNVVVAVRDMLSGEEICVEGVGKVSLLCDVPRGHKIALRNFEAGDDVIKYGFPIGHVNVNVCKGGMIDHSILKTNLEGLLEYTYAPETAAAASNLLEGLSERGFEGFRRANGDVGVRNQIWVIPTVGCVNGIANSIAEKFRERKVGNMGTVDAIVSFPHNYGCSQLGDDHQNTRRILADMVHHPNAGGVLVVGLGCENNQMSAFKELVGEVDASRIKFFETQKVEGDEVEYGLNLLEEIFAVCSKDERSHCPLSDLKIGLKCGGSDGLSGITANPLLGVFSDYLISCGGTAVLTEVPEMFGAETILMNRCKDEATFEKTVSLINNFKKYFTSQGMPVYENPSPGNKAGGISTLEEKSLGCTQKCGSAIVEDVLEYGMRITSRGLNLLSAPGNDLVASTALASSGCQMVLFTTGRGTPFGSFVPTMKISTNTALSERKSNWIDFNAGVLVEGTPMRELAERFVDFVLDAASGTPLKSEESGYREIAIFKTGVTL